MKNNSRKLNLMKEGFHNDGDDFVQRFSRPNMKDYIILYVHNFRNIAWINTIVGIYTENSPINN